MRAAKISLLAAVLGLAGLSTTSSAHHSFHALYDSDKPITILGHVKKYNFINPHIIISVDVEEEGETVTYHVETMAAFLAQRFDFGRDALEEGDPVQIVGWSGRSHRTEIGGQTLVLPDGTVFELRQDGASPGNPRNAEMFGFVGETKSPSPTELLAEKAAMESEGSDEAEAVSEEE